MAATEANQRKIEELKQDLTEEQRQERTSAENAVPARHWRPSAQAGTTAKHIFAVACPGGAAARSDQGCRARSGLQARFASNLVLPSDTTVRAGLVLHETSPSAPASSEPLMAGPNTAVGGGST